MLARIYFLSGLLFVSMLFINVLNASTDKRLREWVQEYKCVKRESEALHRFIRKRQKCEKKIDKRIGLIIPPAQRKKCANTKIPGIKKYLHLHNDTLIKDSNYYIAQIFRYKKDIALCKWQLSEMDKVMKEKLRLAYHSSEPKNQVNKSVQNRLKKDKRLYYLHKQLDKKQQDILKKMNLKPFQQLLDQAQKQNRLLSAQFINNPALSLPPHYQLKSRIQQVLPQNIAGIEPDKKQEFQDKFSRATNNIGALLDSMNLQINLDSMHFKKNPHREMAFKDRIEKYMDWQAQKSNNYYPAILDIYFRLGFKLSPNLTPQAGILYKVGMGKDIEHIRISQQGFGLRGGANYLFYKNGMLFISYEQAWFKANPETNNAFKAIPGLVCGMGIKGKITLQIGYDFLQRLNPQKGNAWVLRFGI